MTSKTTELKIRKKRLGAILTATNDRMGIPLETQLETVLKWSGSASKTILFTTQNVKYADGLRITKAKTENTPVVTILRHYVVQIPGLEIFAFTAPNIHINPDQQAFFDYVDKEKMERAWAAFAGAGNGTPKVFFISAPVLPHILRDMPETLTFESEAWAVWLHNWLGRFMLKHRYFDASRFGVASEITPIKSSLTSTPVSLTIDGEDVVKHKDPVDVLIEIGSQVIVDQKTGGLSNALDDISPKPTSGPFIEPPSLVNPMPKRKPGRPRTKPQLL